MEFTKMQGIGNDYVYVDCFKEKVEHPGAVSKYVSDRHFGIGSDGLILICPSDKADCRMDMYNADGSRGSCVEMEYAVWENMPMIMGSWIKTDGLLPCRTLYRRH